ncbi:MAG: hypothetical protein WDO19_11800 [Bacteroidota bacterium]
MKIKICILAFLALSCSRQVLAHAMWIETNHVGINGKQQDVKIYFGEFADKDISLTEKWFSDIKNFSLIVIAPDKSETRLSAAAAKDFYKAVFTPTQNGVYTLVMHHTVKDVYGTMKIDYNSSATVLVGNQFKGNDALTNNNVISLFADSAFAAKQKSSIKLQAVYDAKSSIEQEIKIFAPNGWAKELYTDEKGEVHFTPLWPGKYMAEFAYTEKTPGEHNGKKYDEIWKVATYIITVK